MADCDMLLLNYLGFCHHLCTYRRYRHQETLGAAVAQMCIFEILLRAEELSLSSFEKNHREQMHSPASKI